MRLKHAAVVGELQRVVFAGSQLRIQHKYSNPDPEDAFFMVEKGVAFIDRFVRDEMGYEIADFVPLEHLEEFDL